MFVIVFIFEFINCNVVLLDAIAANIDSNSLALTTSIFTLSTYMGIVIASPVLCRKNLNVNINVLSLTENNVTVYELENKDNNKHNVSYLAHLVRRKLGKAF